MDEKKDVLTREFAKKRKEQIDNVEYDLLLKIEKKSETYRGKCKISFFLRNLNDGVLIDSISKIKKVFVNGKENDFKKDGVSIKMVDGFKENSYNEVLVEYESQFNHTGAGLHRFLDPEDKREYIYTHFEPYDAHRVFPCFDQPDLKAELSLRVEIPGEWVAISNEAVEKEETSGRRKIVEFKKTKKLSTYLFEICVGEYGFVEDFYEKMPLKIYFRKSLK